MQSTTPRRHRRLSLRLTAALGALSVAVLYGAAAAPQSLYWVNPMLMIAAVCASWVFGIRTGRALATRRNSVRPGTARR
jgi:predicted membrane protein